MALPGKDERSLLHDRLDHAQHIRGYPIMVGPGQCDLRPIWQAVDPCNGNSNRLKAAKGWQTGKAWTINPSDKLLLRDVTNALGLDQHLAGCCPTPIWTVLIGNDRRNLLPVADSHVMNYGLRCNQRAQTSTYHAESESSYKAYFSKAQDRFQGVDQSPSLQGDLPCIGHLFDRGQRVILVS